MITIRSPGRPLPPPSSEPELTATENPAAQEDETAGFEGDVLRTSAHTIHSYTHTTTTGGEKVEVEEDGRHDDDGDEEMNLLKRLIKKRSSLTTHLPESSSRHHFEDDEGEVSQVLVRHRRQIQTHWQDITEKEGSPLLKEQSHFRFPDTSCVDVMSGPHHEEEYLHLQGIIASSEGGNNALLQHKRLDERVSRALDASSSMSPEAQKEGLVRREESARTPTDCRVKGANDPNRGDRDEEIILTEVSPSLSSHFLYQHHYHSPAVSHADVSPSNQYRPSRQKDVHHQRPEVHDRHHHQHLNQTQESFVPVSDSEKVYSHAMTSSGNHSPARDEVVASSAPQSTRATPDILLQDFPSSSKDYSAHHFPLSQQSQLHKEHNKASNVSQSRITPRVSDVASESGGHDSRHSREKSRSRDQEIEDCRREMDGRRISSLSNVRPSTSQNNQTRYFVVKSDIHERPSEPSTIAVSSAKYHHHQHQSLITQHRMSQYQYEQQMQLQQQEEEHRRKLMQHSFHQSQGQLHARVLELQRQDSFASSVEGGGRGDTSPAASCASLPQTLTSSSAMVKARQITTRASNVNQTTRAHRPQQLPLAGSQVRTLPSKETPSRGRSLETVNRSSSSSRPVTLGGSRCSDVELLDVRSSTDALSRHHHHYRHLYGQQRPKFQSVQRLHSGYPQQYVSPHDLPQHRDISRYAENEALFATRPTSSHSFPCFPSEAEQEFYHFNRMSDISKPNAYRQRQRFHEDFIEESDLTSPISAQKPFDGAKENVRHIVQRPSRSATHVPPMNPYPSTRYGTIPHQVLQVSKMRPGVSSTMSTPRLFPRSSSSSALHGGRSPSASSVPAMVAGGLSSSSQVIRIRPFLRPIPSVGMTSTDEISDNNNATTQITQLHTIESPNGRDKSSEEG